MADRRIVWALFVAAVGTACSLLAPPDDHFLGGTRAEGGDGGTSSGGPNGEGPLPSTPKAIGCGSLSCSSAQECCAARRMQDAAVTLECKDAPNSAKVTFCPFTATCDENADCTGGELCCLTQASTGVTVTGTFYFSCRSSACPEGVQLCRKSSDCAGVPCVAKTCDYGPSSIELGFCDGHSPPTMPCH